jgi:hypothetical protein
MDHPHFGTNLVASDCHVFGHLNKYIAGKNFAADDNVKQAVTSRLQAFDIDLFCASLLASNALVGQMLKCGL